MSIAFMIEKSWLDIKSFAQSLSSQKYFEPSVFWVESLEEKFFFFFIFFF